MFAESVEAAGLTRLESFAAKVAGYATLLQHLDNNAFVEHFRAVGAWADEHVPFPGACFADLTHASCATTP